MRSELKIGTSKAKAWGRWVTGPLFVVAGILHFAKPEAYLKIMPPFVPFPLAMVYLSGFFEIAGGVGLLIPRTRNAAALGLIALLIAVFPANVYMFTRQLAADGLSTYTTVLAVRLPLQVLLILWVNSLRRPKI